MICPNCEKEIANNIAQCPHCGCHFPVREVPKPAPAPAPAPKPVVLPPPVQNAGAVRATPTTAQEVIVPPVAEPTPPQNEYSAASTKFCKHCGKQVLAAAAFCKFCGSALKG